jgi:hypothetical protein
MGFAGIVGAEDLHMASVRQFENPEVRLGMHTSQAQHVW